MYVFGVKSVVSKHAKISHLNKKKTRFYIARKQCIGSTTLFHFESKWNLHLFAGAFCAQLERVELLVSGFLRNCVCIHLDTLLIFTTLLILQTINRRRGERDREQLIYRRHKLSMLYGGCRSYFMDLRKWTDFHDFRNVRAFTECQRLDKINNEHYRSHCKGINGTSGN